MEDFLVCGLVESLGIEDSLILFILLILPLIGLLVLMQILKFHLRDGSLKEALSYGRYHIEIQNNDGLLDETVIIKAWNKANAVERAFKRTGKADGYVYIASKLKEIR